MLRLLMRWISKPAGSIPSHSESLHTKALVVDRHALLVGCFNLDPRSAHINSESGIILGSEELAQ